MNWARKRLALVSFVSLVLLLSGCTATDPITDDMYVQGDLYVWDGSSWISVNDNIYTAGYAGMYRHEYGTATDIQVSNAWHLNNGCTQGTLSSTFTFDPGQQLSITAYADNGDGKTQVTTAVAHGMSNGWVVSIAGTTNYDSVYVIEQVTASTFVIDTGFVADDGASTGEQGAFLQTSQAGIYLAIYTASITPTTANDTVEFTLYQNATQVTKSESQHKLGAVGDYGVCTGQAILTLSANDLILWAVENLSGNGDFTIRDGNVTLVRIGP